MTGRVIFFTNLHSHGVRRKGSRLKAFHETHAKPDYIALDARTVAQTQRQLKALALTSQDHLFLEGGDGTIQQTLSSLMNNLPSTDDCPKISLIAGGLTNQIAANIGLKATHDEQILAAINTPNKGLRPTPILRLDGLSEQPLFGCLFSTGAMPFVTEYYAEKIRTNPAGGKAAIAATIVKAVAGNQTARDALMPATELSLRIESGASVKTKTGAHLGTVVTTLPSLILGLDPFWGKGDGDLRVFYADARARRLVRNLTGLWLGRKSTDRSPDGLESFQADQLQYHYNGPVVLDGESISLTDKLTLSATPPLPFIATPTS